MCAVFVDSAEEKENGAVPHMLTVDPISRVFVCTAEPRWLFQHISAVSVTPESPGISRTGPLFNCF